ncbi:hypothetical protein B0H13DRAFT_1897842 [Mycena leptocephala]|nr:hypothetical protein B0H13DRAFT_1897842 [Mycena leptocephala]
MLFHVHLNQLRRVLLADHVNIYPAKDLFSDLEVLPKGTLITLALAHGLAIPATRISLHYATPLPLTSADTLIAPGTVDDPATCLQLYTMRQIAPVLTSRALRRLLDMHGVKYAPRQNQQTSQASTFFFTSLGSRQRRKLQTGKTMTETSHSESKDYDVYDQIYRLKANVTERIYDKSDLLYF